MTNDQNEWMQMAIRYSEEGMNKNEGGPFGCVIVRGSEVIGVGNNKVTSTNDPTAHAEVTAIRDACAKLQVFELPDCELYTSCEPCPMCLGAIYWARISRIYYACTRQDAAAIGFDDDFLYKEMSRMMDEREIPAHQMMRDDAYRVFEAWMVKPDKLEY